MCTCASCEYTDSFNVKGFAAWPRGEPAGEYSSNRAYAAHARHVWAGAYKTIAFTRGQAPRYPSWTTSKALGDGGEHRKYPRLYDAQKEHELTTSEYVEEFIRSNEYLTEDKIAKRAAYAAMVKEEQAARKREKASPTYVRPARPAKPGKAQPHFPEPDRQPETAKIYDMRKAKAKPEEKRARGRPPTGKPFLVRLEPEHVKRAEQLGAGNISAGIRKALAA